MRKKQQIVLEHIAQAFEPEQTYDEHSVNHLLVDFHDDVACLRRALVEHQFMIREKGRYQLAKPA